jgi:hypothetical protein
MSLLDRFRGDSGLILIQKGGSLVIRRLCAAMGAEKVFREFASVLDQEQDLVFASTMVQVSWFGLVSFGWLAGWVGNWSCLPYSPLHIHSPSGPPPPPPQKTHPPGPQPHPPHGLRGEGAPRPAARGALRRRGGAGLRRPLLMLEPQRRWGVCVCVE